MESRSAEDMRDELNRLTLEHIESLKTETFLGTSEKALLEREERLKRIRKVSADFLAALKKK
jgi:hypothetical protein